MAKRSVEAWAKWRKLIAEQSRSGQSVVGFCRQRGIGTTHFFAWRRKLSEAEAGRFVEVRVEADGGAAGQSRALEVKLEGGRSVMVEQGFDAAHLRAVLAVLEERV